MRIFRTKLFAAGIFLLLAPAYALAHFTLVTPPSSLQTENGGKGAPPCGEGTDSNIVTQVRGGHPLGIRITEFIFHPGHYRFALSVKSRAELPADPDVVEADGLSVNAPIQSPPKVPVLADGVFVHTDPPLADWQTDLMLPNLNCEKCTLQVIEFMAEHGANVGGGFYYHHCSDLKIVADPGLPPADSAWPRADLASNQAASAFSHIADGGGWQTAITLVNLDLVPAAFTLNFWGDNGAPFAPSLVGAGPHSTISGTIAVGGSQMIQTDGSPPGTSTGWAEVLSAQLVGGTAIFHLQSNGQEAAVPLMSSGGRKVVLPYDIAPGVVLGIALANTDPARDATISVAVRDQQGNAAAVPSVILLGHHQHTAFVLAVPPDGAPGQRGVVEFDSPTVDIFALGIRGNNGTFTSIQALNK